MRLSTKLEIGSAGASRRPSGRREIQGPAGALTQDNADAQSACPDLPNKEISSGMVTADVGTSTVATGEQPMHVPSQVRHADEAGVHSIGCHDQTCRKLAETMMKKERASRLMAQLAEGAVKVPCLSIKFADEPPVRRAAASIGRARQKGGGIHTCDVGTLFTDVLKKATVVGKRRPDTGGGEVAGAQIKNQAGNTSGNEVQKMLAVQDMGTTLRDESR
ncbi:hypothetical protein HPB47_011824 [Ixodes persulcatus]|uniref:Uncharacterized protein n=1 Tax=Ixodes persulcatus TaxID=34615 RepID=A0AC60NV54_IXOPE|nr:hypothetical protein HPB47_011824 [Ixodes persulcatus]